MVDKITLKDLEKESKMANNEFTIEESSLSDWYNKIREKSLTELSTGDLARLIRQDMFKTNVIEESIKRLWINPFVGKLYDGELFYMLTNHTTQNFWKDNKSLKEDVEKLLNYIVERNLVFQFDWVSIEDREEFLIKLWVLKDVVST